jgi:large subunit ribosomal protein L35
LRSIEKSAIMPKMKTHSSAKKRFKLTGKGKVKRFHANSSHLMRKKSKKAKLRLRDSGLVSEADEKRVKRMLCKG